MHNSFETFSWCLAHYRRTWEDFFKPPVFGIVTHVPRTKHMLVPINWSLCSKWTVCLTVKWACGLNCVLGAYAVVWQSLLWACDQTLGKHGSLSVNDSQPNQWRSDTVLLHGGHNDVFLSACHLVCALCLSGTTSCLGFQMLDLMSFCTAGWVWSFFEMTEIFFFNCQACLFSLWYLPWCCLLDAACIF